MRIEPGNLLEQQCLEYFQEAEVFRRLLKGFRRKYSSYNSFAGTVVLKNLTPADRELLEGFLQRNYHGKMSASVSAELFARALAGSRFSSISPVRLLELYFREPMVGKREIQDQYRERWDQMLQRLQQQADTCGAAARGWMMERQKELSSARQIDEKRLQETEEELRSGIRILQELPVQARRYEYLAVFAARLTGDPHAFDPDQPRGRQLKQIVDWYADSEFRISAANEGIDSTVSDRGEDIEAAQSETDGKSDIEVFHSLALQKRYLQAGIIRDDVSNYAMLSNVHAINPNGERHRGMEGFFAENQMVSVPLSVILQWQRVECPDQRIYIVENPTIFAILCGQNQGIACMCMNGQPRLSSLLVLDLLRKDDTEIYYSGDLDPEGLLIAEKLKRYYRGRFHCWHMSPEDYRNSISSKQLSEKRLRLLERIKDPELLPVVKDMKEKKLAGYQENLQWTI